MKKPEPAELEQFRKLDAQARVAAMRGKREMKEISFELDRAADINEESRTVWLSIASEEPYERWWGVEVLDCRKGSIRDARLKSGMAVLVGHDADKQVGVVEAYEITPGGKLRVKARFGRSAYAEEIFQDVLDGIRRNASVGYIIHDLVLEKQEEDQQTYRVTDWEPYEGSLVPIPADPTVGVGRSSVPPVVPQTSQPKQEKSMEKTPEQIAQDAVARERQRVADLTAAGAQYKDFGGPDVAAALAADPSGTVEQFNVKMLAAVAARQAKPTPTAAPAASSAAPAYGDAARTRFRYGRLKSFRDMTLSDGSPMKAEEAAYRAGMWMAATLYQKDWAQRWCRDNGFELFARDANGQVRVMSGLTTAAGAALVPVEMEQAIIDLRDEYGVARKLLRVRPMGSDQLSIPRRTGGVTAYFFGDDDGTGITASDKSWDNVLLSAKKLGALTRVSKDLEEDAIISVVDDLAMEMAWAFAVKEDQCFIDGDGTSTYGGIQGFRPKFVGTAYASRYTIAAGHDTFPEVDAADLAGVMGSVAKFGTQGAKWLCSNTAKALVFDRLKASAGGNDVVSLGGAAAPAYLGYEIVTSEAMPAGAATDYTNLVMMAFGRFDLAGSMGNRRGIEVQVLRERYAELGQLGIVATERFDINIHDLGTTSAKGPVAAMYGGT